MEGLIQCPKCNRKYKKENVLKEHLRNVHQQQEVDSIDVASCDRVAPLAKRKARAPKNDEARQLRLETERKCAAIVERARTNPDDCSICMSAPAGGGAVIPCGHSTFCYKCLQEWGRDKGCPMCRGNVQLIQELRI